MIGVVSISDTHTNKINISLAMFVFVCENFSLSYLKDCYTWPAVIESTTGHISFVSVATEECVYSGKGLSALLNVW